MQRPLLHRSYRMLCDEFDRLRATERDLTAYSCPAERERVDRDLFTVECEILERFAAPRRRRLLAELAAVPVGSLAF
jgi:hypothetical protein